MRPIALLCLVSLVGCDALASSDPFEDPYLDVYDTTLAWGTEASSLTGRLGLTFIANDAIDESCDAHGSFTGRWELDDPSDRFADGEGSVRGAVDCDGRTVRLYLFDGVIDSEANDRGVLYELVGEHTADGVFEGTWERVGSYPEGTFSARRVRQATEHVTVP